MTDYRRAIGERCSRRSYLGVPLAKNAAQQLGELARRLGEEYGLRLLLIENDAAAFRGFRASYGMLSGVNHYFALLGKTDDPDRRVKLGYAGEQLVLEATVLGLGTCWVGGTFSREACSRKLELLPQEDLVCVIPVGQVPDKSLREKLVSKLAHRSSKTVEELYTAQGKPSSAFLAGMEAVRRAPSALNKQPVHFTLADGVVTAAVEDVATFQGLDLGIAMLHFEVGSGCGKRFAQTEKGWQLPWE